MLNKQLFKAKCALNDEKIKNLAEYININPQTLRKKINENGEFKCSQIRSLSKRWDLTPNEIYEIFIK